MTFLGAFLPVAVGISSSLASPDPVWDILGKKKARELTALPFLKVVVPIQLAFSAFQSLTFILCVTSRVLLTLGGIRKSFSTPGLIF